MVCVYVMPTETRGVRSPAAGVTGVCDLLGMGTGNTGAGN